MAYVCDGFIGTCRATTSFKGQWINATNRYLGLKFKIHGQTHYGWARLSIQYENFTFAATLTGYAYETIPNKAITAGETKGPDDEQATPMSLKSEGEGTADIRHVGTGSAGKVDLETRGVYGCGTRKQLTSLAQYRDRTH